MPNQNSVSLEDLCDANLIESIREHARWQSPCEVVEKDGLLLIAGHSAFPGAYRNSIARLDRRVPAAEALRRAQEFFQARGRGFTVWVRTRHDEDIEKLLLAAERQRITDGPCMLIETRLADVDPPAGVRIEAFTEERHVRDAIAINAEAYQALGLAAEQTRKTFQLPERVLSERVIGFVAYQNGRAVSTALTIMSGASAGVYWVGTVSAAQRMGLAGLCTRLATNAGFDHGAQVVTLQASPFGEPVYRRLGYRTYERVRWYLHPVPV
jgi:hypothetical protein